MTGPRKMEGGRVSGYGSANAKAQGWREGAVGGQGSCKAESQPAGLRNKQGPGPRGSDDGLALYS